METRKNERKSSIRLTNGQRFRAAVTKAALIAQERIEKGLPVRATELAWRDALDRKLAEDPGFAWTTPA